MGGTGVFTNAHGTIKYRDVQSTDSSITDNVRELDIHIFYTPETATEVSTILICSSSFIHVHVVYKLQLQTEVSKNLSIASIHICAEVFETQHFLVATIPPLFLLMFSAEIRNICLDFFWLYTG
jgi:hypothetical protein